MRAGVVKLVDARDSKSRGALLHVGSIPTSGTFFIWIAITAVFSRGPVILSGLPCEAHEG